jgi:hypothetical protein
VLAIGRGLMIIASGAVMFLREHNLENTLYCQLTHESSRMLATRNAASAGGMGGGGIGGGKNVDVDANGDVIPVWERGFNEWAGLSALANCEIVNGSGLNLELGNTCFTVVNEKTLLFAVKSGFKDGALYLCHIDTNSSVNNGKITT